MAKPLAEKGGGKKKKRGGGDPLLSNRCKKAVGAWLRRDQSIDPHVRLDGGGKREGKRRDNLSSTHRSKQE